LLSALEPLEPPEPLDGELEDAAGFGALEPPELEPLSEDDFAAAGFGAGFAPPEPPEGPPATLATVRTATEEGANPGDIAEAAVEACVDESSVPSIHTRAAAPRSTDTDAARHSRTNTATSTRTGIARDAVGTGTEGTTQLRRPPAEATDTITNAPRGSLDTATSQPSPVTGRSDGSEPSQTAVAHDEFTRGFPGLAGTQLRPNRSPRSHHAEACPERGALRYADTGARHELSDADQDYRDGHPPQPNFRGIGAAPLSGHSASSSLDLEVSGQRRRRG